MFQIPRKPKEKYSIQEKQLCPSQVSFIKYHVNSCDICKESFHSSKGHGIPTKPACQRFLRDLQAHIDKCPVCNQANKKWNEDAIPITDEVREVIRLFPDLGLIKDPKRLNEYLKTLKGVDIEKIQRVQTYLLDQINRKNAPN